MLPPDKNLLKLNLVLMCQGLILVMLIPKNLCNFEIHWVTL
jgi:hypothetical protein